VRGLALGVRLAVGVVVWIAAPAFAEGPTEAAVKADYLYKFADFVEWPAAGAASPAQLCVAGDDPFGSVLDQAIRGQTIDGKPVVVTRLDRVDKGAPCAILFLAPSHRQPLADALDKLKGTPVLTVTDDAPTGQRGMIDFVMRDNRVRFRIDPTAAERSGLTISSKLLSLAVKP
jgi:hypothetical protein